MNSYYIDAHCHLDLFENIQGNVEKEDSLPIKSIAVTNAPYAFLPNLVIFDKDKNIRVGLGMRPELASQYASQFDKFVECLPATRYVGEIGLDGSVRLKNTYLHNG